MAELLGAAALRWNRECDESDALMDRLESSDAKNEQLEKQNRELQSQLDSAQAAPVDTSEIERLGGIINDLEGELNDALDDRDGFKMRSAALDNQVTELSKRADQIPGLERRIKATEATLAEVKSALMETQVDLSDSQALVAELQTNKAKHENQLNQAKKKSNQSQTLLNNAEVELKQLRSDNPKKLKASVKSFKEKNASLLASKDLLHKENKQYRAESKVMLEELRVMAFKYSMAKATGIYSKDGNTLMLMPNMLKVRVGEEADAHYQVQLIFSDNHGIWRQVTLDQNGNLAVGQIKCEQYAEKTQKLIKGCMPQLSKNVANFAHEWLNKVKKQDWTVYEDDLYKFANEEDNRPV